jgi:hypothetical protein
MSTKLSPAQRKALEAIARGEVMWFPYGDYYRRRDARAGIRADTMTALFSKGLVARPVRQFGNYKALTVEPTDAGREALR